MVHTLRVLIVPTCKIMKYTLLEVGKHLVSFRLYLYVFNKKAYIFFPNILFELHITCKELYN